MHEIFTITTYFGSHNIDLCKYLHFHRHVYKCILLQICRLYKYIYSFFLYKGSITKGVSKHNGNQTGCSNRVYLCVKGQTGQ